MSNKIYLDRWGNPQVGDPETSDKLKHEKFIESLRELQTAGLLFVFNGRITLLDPNHKVKLPKRKSKQEMDDEEAEQQKQAAYAHMELITTQAKRKDFDNNFYKGLVDSFSFNRC